MLKEIIKNYKPSCKQEEKDKEVFLKYLETFDNCFERENVFGHVTSSAFIVNQDHTKVLMAYHNIYKSYAWLGGHNDGLKDTLKVALKEAKEESGIKNLTLLLKDIISLDIIEVTGHFKNGEWITPHVHLNVTYLFEGKETDKIQVKEDENSSVAWLPIKDLKKIVKEENMKVVYQKIIQKMETLF